MDNGRYALAPIHAAFTRNPPGREISPESRACLTGNDKFPIPAILSHSAIRIWAAHDNPHFWKVERRYMESRELHVKRSLRFDEYGDLPDALQHIPQCENLRLANEVAAMQQVGQYTDMPVPRVVMAFEDAGSLWAGTNVVPGVPLSTLPSTAHDGVYAELRPMVARMQQLCKASQPGSLRQDGVAILPDNVRKAIRTDYVKLKRSDTKDYVLCHGDLSPRNILVEPEAPHRIMAIVGWESAGFYPKFFESPLGRLPRAMLPVGVDPDGRSVNDMRMIQKFIEDQRHEEPYSVHIGSAAQAKTFNKFPRGHNLYPPAVLHFSC